MNVTQLQDLPQVQLLDVRLADDFEAAHLEGAANNCVFEVAFPERLAETAPDKSLPTVVYGANGESAEAQAAEEKLRREGYGTVHILAGGLQQAVAEGFPTTTGEPLPESPEITDGTHAIDLEESRLEWLGRNLINKHWGTAPLTSGELIFSGGELTGGSFAVDMRGLKCTDLKGSELHDVLIAHLQNDDFFDVENHPEARVEIRSASRVPNAEDGAPNLQIEADLTLRGRTLPIAFTAAAGITPEGQAAAQASFSIDRTLWGILYGSGKFFHRLAGHLVNDLIEFQVRILTK